MSSTLKTKKIPISRSAHVSTSVAAAAAAVAAPNKEVVATVSESRRDGPVPAAAAAAAANVAVSTPVVMQNRMTQQEVLDFRPLSKHITTTVIDDAIRITADVYFQRVRVLADVDTIIISMLNDRYGNKCGPYGYIIRDSIQLISRGSAALSGQDFTGFFSYQVRFEAQLLTLKKDDIIESPYMGMNRVCVLSKLPPLNIIIPLEVVSEDKQKQIHDYAPGTMMNLRVEGVRIMNGKTDILVIAEFADTVAKPRKSSTRTRGGAAASSGLMNTSASAGGVSSTLRSDVDTDPSASGYVNFEEEEVVQSDVDEAEDGDDNDDLEEEDDDESDGADESSDSDDSDAVGSDVDPVGDNEEEVGIEDEGGDDV